MSSNADTIYDKSNQVKILILFTMSRLALPVNIDTLTQLIMRDERIGYFDVAECVEKLVKSKHLQLADGKYNLTPKGLEGSKILEKDLPHSAKQKIEKAAKTLNETMKKDSLIVTRVEPADGSGYNVILSLADGNGEILSVTLYTANKKHAGKLEKGFRNNAHSMYKGIIELIMK